MNGILGFYLSEKLEQGVSNDFTVLYKDEYFSLYGGTKNSDTYSFLDTDEYCCWVEGTVLAGGGLTNGEIFEKLALSDELVKSDLDHLEGHYSIILYSKITHQLVISTDVYGVGSLVYLERSGGVVLSDNLQLVNECCGSILEISLESIYYYLDFHVIPQPYTIYKSVFKILPGENRLYTYGNDPVKYIRKLVYQPSENNEKLILAELEGAQNQSINDFVKDLDKSDYGAFLSGGIDSTSVVGAITRTQGKGINSFSIGFNEKEYDELEFSRIAVSNFDCNAYEYVVEPEDLFELIDHIVESFGEPFGNSSSLPVYYCAKLANSNGVSTLLAGDGGDELFGGNERYLKNKVFSIYKAIPKILRWILLESYISKLKINNRIYNRVINFISRANQENPERFFNDDAFGTKYLDKLYKKKFLNSIEPGLSLKHLENIYASAEANSELNRLLYLDMRTAIASNDLYKVRTMCKSANVNVRFPMLHPSVVGLSLKLGESMKLKGFEKRYIYRKYLAQFVPDEIINKKKKGFGLPISVWLRENEKVKAFFKDTLLSESNTISSFINLDFVEKLFNDHQSKRWDNASYLWVLLILELWLSRYQYKLKID